MTAGLAASKRQSKGLTFAALVYTKRSAELRAARNAPQSGVPKGSANSKTVEWGRTPKGGVIDIGADASFRNLLFTTGRYRPLCKALHECVNWTIKSR